MGACINNTQVQKPSITRSVSRRTSIEMNITVSGAIMKMKKFQQMKNSGKRNSLTTEQRPSQLKQLMNRKRNSVGQHSIFKFKEQNKQEDKQEKQDSSSFV